MKFANATNLNRKSGKAQPTCPACRGGIYGSADHSWKPG